MEIGTTTPSVPPSRFILRGAAHLALLALVALPLSGAIAGPATSAGTRLLLAALVCAAAVRPADALLVCAGLLPISAPLSGVLQSGIPLGESLLLALLGGWLAGRAARLVARSREMAVEPPWELFVPVLVLGAVVAASVLVQLLVAQAFVDYPLPFAGRIVLYLARDYIGHPREFPALQSGLPVLESLALFTAVIAISRRQPAVAVRLAAIATVAATGVAAFNVARFAGACLRSGRFFEAVAYNMTRLRINGFLEGPNSAGSYLAMMLLVAVGLVAATRGRSRFGWAACALTIAAALWLTGSRAALLATPLAALGLLAWLARVTMPVRWRRRVAIAAACMTVGFLLVVKFFPLQTPDRSVAQVTLGRFEMAKAALRMTASHPVFGVGVGRFYGLSGNFITPAFLPSVKGRENAHNNFLQVLAELGLFGLGAFTWTLVAAATHARRAARRHDTLLAGAATGIVAFLLTCLTGHPLLVPDVSHAFWLVLALVVALSRADAVSPSSDALPPPRAGGRGRAGWRRMVPALIVVVLAVSVPLRARMFLRDEADLSEAAIGFSDWQSDGLGVAFRTMTGRARFYVPSPSCGLTLPLEADSTARDTAASGVEIRIDGRLANIVAVSPIQWNTVRMVWPVRVTPRSSIIDLRSRSSTAAIRVGRPVVRPCS